jgi:hypothetical protein
MLLLVPVGYFVAMWVLYQPVRHQQALTGSRDPAAFDAAVLASGGVASTRTGLLVDIGFIALVAAVVPAVFAAHGRPWWVPLLACGLDLIEDALALRLLAGGATMNGVKVLKAVATAKLVAYAVVLAIALQIGAAALTG